MDKEKSQTSGNIYLHPDSVVVERGKSGRLEGNFFKCFLGNCNQLGATIEQMYYIKTGPVVAVRSGKLQLQCGQPPALPQVRVEHHGLWVWDGNPKDVG